MTTNYRIMFKDIGGPSDGVSIVDGGGVAVSSIVVGKTSSYVFDADDPASDATVRGFRFQLSFLPAPPLSSQIVNVVSTPDGRRTTFTAMNPCAAYMFTLVADATAPSGRQGSSISGRKPVIRNVGGICVPVKWLVGGFLLGAAVGTTIALMS